MKRQALQVCIMSMPSYVSRLLDSSREFGFIAEAGVCQNMQHLFYCSLLQWKNDFLQSMHANPSIVPVLCVSFLCNSEWIPLLTFRVLFSPTLASQYCCKSLERPRNPKLDARKWETSCKVSRIFPNGYHIFYSMKWFS